MTSSFKARAFDTRVVFQIYAVLALAAGLLIAGWPPRSDLTPDPWANLVLMRIIGAVTMAAGCCGAALSHIEEAWTRHKALGWFLAGHVIVLVMILMQAMSIGKPDPEDVALPTLSAAVIVLFYFWMTADGYGHRALGARNGTDGVRRPSVDQLRTQYEEQIREAAGQEERNRLARDLHDSIKQQIFVMQTAAATAQVRYDADPAGAKVALEQLRQSARDAMTEMEAMLDHLRATPLESVGLVEALKKQCEALALRTGSQVRFDARGLPSGSAFAPGAQRAIFRIAQEALANVARHARARSVDVALRADAGSVTLDIRDDGTGFEPESAPPGMGLANMRARAAAVEATLSVSSWPGAGTTVSLSVPCMSPGTRIRAAHRQRMSLWASLAALGIVKVVWDAHVLGWRSAFFAIDMAVVAAMAALFLWSLVGYVRFNRADEMPWHE